MRIFSTKRFQKRFEKLPKKVQNQFEKRLDVFLKNPFDASLQNHHLKGYLVGLRAFSVTGDYRVIFRILDHESVKFIDVGTHSQVYE